MSLLDEVQAWWAAETTPTKRTDELQETDRVHVQRHGKPWPVLDLKADDAVWIGVWRIVPEGHGIRIYMSDRSSVNAPADLKWRVK